MTCIHQDDTVAINADVQALLQNYTKCNVTLCHTAAPFASVVPFSIAFLYFCSNLSECCCSTLVYAIFIKCLVGTFNSIIPHLVGHTSHITNGDCTFTPELIIHNY